MNENDKNNRNLGKKVAAGIMLGGTTLGTTAQVANTANAYIGEKYVKKTKQKLKDLFSNKSAVDFSSLDVKNAKEAFVKEINACANRNCLGDKIQAKLTDDGKEIFIKDTRNKNESKLYVTDGEKILVYKPGLVPARKSESRGIVNSWFNKKHVSGISSCFEYSFTEKLKESGLQELFYSIAGKIMFSNKLDKLVEDGVLIRDEKTGRYLFRALDPSRTIHSSSNSYATFFSLKVEDEGIRFHKILQDESIIKFNDEEGIEKLEQYIENAKSIKEVLSKIGILTEQESSPSLSVDDVSGKCVTLKPKEGDTIICTENEKQREISSILINISDFTVSVGLTKNEKHGDTVKYYNLLEKKKAEELSSLLSSIEYDSKTYNRVYANMVIKDLKYTHPTLKKILDENGYLNDTTNNKPTSLKVELTNESFVVHDDLQNEDVVKVSFSDNNFREKLDNIEILLKNYFPDILYGLNCALNMPEEKSYVEIENKQYKITKCNLYGSEIELTLTKKDKEETITKKYDIFNDNDAVLLFDMTQKFRSAAISTENH